MKERKKLWYVETPIFYICSTIETERHFGLVFHRAVMSADVPTVWDKVIEGVALFLHFYVFISKCRNSIGYLWLAAGLFFNIWSNQMPSNTVSFRYVSYFLIFSSHKVDQKLPKLCGLKQVWRAENWYRMPNMPHNVRAKAF